jgi:UPF0755 protein
MKKLFTYFLVVGLIALLLVASLAGGAWYWANRAIDLTADKVEFIVAPGSNPKSIARAMNEAGIPISEDGFAWLARLTEQDKLIKAGGYEARLGDTPRQLLDRLARGEMVQRQVTLLEGWTYAQMRDALRANPDIKQTLGDITDEDLMERLGSPVKTPEGLFFPDTYIFTPGTSDYDLLRRAYQQGQQVLNAIWEQRQPDLPIKTPYEALILASIVEKETGHGPERTRISGVFINRLKQGMMLQTDPTVIYGMGDRYQGRIRRADLTRDTPWNTYTRNGLPPTPIAASGRASLLAAVQPEKHPYFYFVSRGNGTSEFAETLTQHNRNVSRYILGRN